MMKAFWLIGAIAASQLAVVSAEAATPNLSGTYTFTLNGLCQSLEVKDEFGKTVESLTGDFQQSIGKFVFRPAYAGAQKGSFSGSMTTIVGWIHNQAFTPGYTYLPNTRFEKSTTPFAGTYTMSASKLTLTLPLETQAFDAIYGTTNASGIAEEVQLLRLLPGTTAGSQPEIVDCSQAITAERK